MHAGKPAIQIYCTRRSYGSCLPSLADLDKSAWIRQEPAGRYMVPCSAPPKSRPVLPSKTARFQREPGALGSSTDQGVSLGTETQIAGPEGSRVGGDCGRAPIQCPAQGRIRPNKAIPDQCLFFKLHKQLSSKPTRLKTPSTPKAGHCQRPAAAGTGIALLRYTERCQEESCAPCYGGRQKPPQSASIWPQGNFPSRSHMSPSVRP